jgi:hypothetical protein
MTDANTRRHSPRLTAIGSIAVLAASVLAIPAASGAGSAKWITLSAGNVNNTGTTPSIAKFGDTYEVIWVVKKTTSFSIEGRILNAAGKPLGGVITALSGWGGISGDPTILADGKQRIIAFAGANSAKPAYDGAAEYYLTSSDGKTWSLSAGSLSAAEHASSATGVAIINDGGAIDAAVTSGGAIAYHLNGPAVTNPAAGVDPTTTSTGSGTQLPGLAVDTKNHQIWAVWWSDSGAFGSKTLGVHAQEISPTRGTMLNAPDSTSKLNGAFGGFQDASVAGRIGGGLYTAYISADVHSVVVWKLGAKKPLAVIHDGTGVHTVQIKAAPRGRLWLYWGDGQGWRAERSNRAATRFGPVTSVPYPKNYNENLLIGSDGSAGPLEAIATLTTPSNVNEIIARQILPRLSVAASPTAVKRGHSFVVEVTDAGDAVKDAAVHFNGQTKKTNARGRVTFKVAGSASLGKHAVTFTLAGYAAASTQVTIKA